MITLPTAPGPREASAALMDFGGFLTPALGGEVQRVNRMGSRYSLNVVMPPLEIEDARVWVSRLIRGKSEGVLFEFPLLGFDPGTPGATVVNGAGQAGTSLAVRGFSAGYAIREGQWFTIVSGGRRYLHNVAAATTASGTGTATLTIAPMLRIQPSDADVLLFNQPMIEGFIYGDELRWQMSLAHHTGIEFAIVEAA